MFDDRGDLSELSDEALISGLTAAMREEHVAAARRLAFIAEVTGRQCDDEDDVSAHQVIDGWAFAKAQVSAACNLGPVAASKQMRIGAALRERLPRTAAVFATGALSATVIDAITWRTHLVTDEEALAMIDAAIAASATEFGVLSEVGLTRAIDLWVEKFDPAAVIRAKNAAEDRYIEFGDKDDPNGVVSFWGRVQATDAVLIKARVHEMAATVCAGDPRAMRERRADAVAAVMAGADRLTCLCGVTDCPGSGKDVRSAAVTIYVLTDQVPAPEPAPAAAAQARPAPKREPESPPPAEPAVSEGGAPPQSQPAPAATTFGPGVMLDGGIIPAPLLAELVATGAKVRPLTEVADLPAESQYRPSTALTAFVRMRSMTCSFQGCNRPAHRCDLDHLTPWPAGATHPGNLQPLCREHHLIKTFRTGPDGFTATIKADGTIEWIAPTG
ncbi:MAG: DUF222 domain-containing protein, partial [Microbacteriaceae bacterium]